MTAPQQKQRIAILGGGPIGLEAALYASSLGYPVTVFERDDIGGNVAQWGHVRMFSPWSINVSALARHRLAEKGTEPPSSEDHCPKGEELIRDYLIPLSRLPELSGRIRTGVNVLACGRKGIAKHTMSPDSGREAYPFRLVMRNREGTETEHESDIVIDATGVYGNFRELGDGGLPALGEREVGSRIDRAPVDVLGKEHSKFAGKRVMLIGSGFSAATTLEALLQLQHESPGTEIFWVSRTQGPTPLKEIENDSLPERARLTRVANEAARLLPPGLQYFGGYLVKAVRQSGGAIEATVADNNGGTKKIVCDRIISNVGYRPDTSIYRELQVHECYATLGPMKLAASLMSQEGEDCLLIESGGADLLRNPEPNFFILGAKSFGTNSAFLLKLGHEQIAQAFTLITGDPDLNLYAK